MIEIAEIDDGLTVPEVLDRGDPTRDMAEGRLKRPPAEVGVAAETAGSLDLQSEIQLQIRFEPRSLGLGQDAEDNLPALLPREHPVVAGLDVSSNSHRGSQSGTEMDIGGPGGDCTPEEIDDVGKFALVAHCWLLSEKLLEIPLRRRRSSAGLGTARRAVSSEILPEETS